MHEIELHKPKLEEKKKPLGADARWYFIDRNDKITSVSPNWDSFALSNDGVSAVEVSVIGQSLWDFISCNETAAFMRALFKYCRKSGQGFLMDYRCDSPMVKRVYAMRIDTFPDGGIIVGHKPLLEEPKPVEEVKKAGQTFRLRQCSFCNDLSLTTDEIDRQVDFPFAEDGIETHVCDECVNSAAAVIGDQTVFLELVSR